MSIRNDGEKISFENGTWQATAWTRDDGSTYYSVLFNLNLFAYNSVQPSREDWRKQLGADRKYDPRYRNQLCENYSIELVDIATIEQLKTTVQSKIETINNFYTTYKNKTIARDASAQQACNLLKTLSEYPPLGTVNVVEIAARAASDERNNTKKLAVEKILGTNSKYAKRFAKLVESI